MKLQPRLWFVLAPVLLAGAAQCAFGADDDDFACTREDNSCLRYESPEFRLDVRLRVGQAQANEDPAITGFLKLEVTQDVSQDNHGVRIVRLRGNIHAPTEVSTALFAGLAVLTGKITPDYARVRTGLEIDIFRDSFGPDRSLSDGAVTETVAFAYGAMAFRYASQGRGDKVPPRPDQIGEQFSLTEKQFNLPSPIPSCGGPLPATCNLTLLYGVDFSHPVALLTIRVTDAGGNPVVGAIVNACIHGQGQSSGPAVTDALGMALMPIPASQPIDGVSVQVSNGDSFRTCAFGATTCAP